MKAEGLRGQEGGAALLRSEGQNESGKPQSQAGREACPHFQSTAFPAACFGRPGKLFRVKPPLAACFDPDATLPNKAAENRRKLQFVERAPPPIDQDFTSEPNFRCPQCKEPYCKWQTYFSKKLGRHLVWARCSAYSKIHNSFKCPFYVYRHVQLFRV